MPLPVKPLRLPPETDKSPTAKSLLLSLKVMLTVAVSPALRADVADVSVTVGATVSTEKSKLLEAMLPLPAASVNWFAATDTLPAVVLFEVGVKVTL